MKACTILVALNEINFDLASKYLQGGSFPAFEEMLERYHAVETFAESRYELLEPWIQWVSIQTGKTFDQHQVFRLGDIVDTQVEQIFEHLEARGLSVGAISSMNARNDLKNPAFFIPDPWTRTAPDGSPFSRRLAAMLSQTVNDNSAKRISLKSLLTLAETSLRTIRDASNITVVQSALRSIKSPWFKSLVLDLLINKTHLSFMRKTSPDFSSVFYNAGAHIQHHYMLNSKHCESTSSNPLWYVRKDDDPILDMLRIYDKIVASYLKLGRRGANVIFATGLSQVLYDRVKFYYRISEHDKFLNILGIRYDTVLPRMTRDFEIKFADRDTAETAKEILQSGHMVRDGLPIFGEIDDRGASLFVTLTYPHEIAEGAWATFDSLGDFDMSKHVDFVAIKNGMHSAKGYAYFSQAPRDLPTQPIHVARLYNLILDLCPDPAGRFMTSKTTCTPAAVGVTLS